MKHDSPTTSRRRLPFLPVCAAVAALSVAMATPPAAAEQESLRNFVRTAEPEPQHLHLEIATRRYDVPDADLPAIELVGVVHIGDPEYYDALQRHLDRQPRVLFEGVGKPSFIGGGEEDEPDHRRAVRTRGALSFLAVRIGRYHQRHGAYPDDLDALMDDVAGHEPGEARWTRAATRDGWGRPLVYQRTEEGYSLKSLGADGEAGGRGVDADITLNLPNALTPDQIEPHDQLQAGMATALGLVFQLDAMNYDRPHFQHSDMSLTELAMALAARREGREPQFDRRHPDQPHGGALLDEHDDQLDELVHLIDGSRFTNAIMRFAQGLLANNPGLQQLSRMVMIDVLGQIDGDLAAMPGLSPAMQELMQVLITDRNRIIVEDVRQLLDEGVEQESISIFYGAGHMPDLARQLRDELDYQPTDQVEWRTAFTADLRDSGLDPQQVEVIRGLLRFQLRQMQ